MEIGEFLAALLPPGIVVVGRRVPRPDRPVPAFYHRYFKTFDSAVAGIEEWAAAGSDVYFALAAYKQGFHPSPKDPSKKLLRVRDNVAALKALWLDIDFKGAYPTMEDALVALSQFCSASGMPRPGILVSSGNGVHVYWPLSSPIPPDRWQGLANALKEATKTLGLQADPVCTADACRVLRPPGTTNWKDPANPKPVTVLYSSGDSHSCEELEAILVPWAASKSPTLHTPNQKIYDELTGGLSKPEGDPPRFDEIVKHCGVLKQQCEAHGKNASEPEWVATLQLLKYCEDGALWVHAISDHHPGYVAAETDRKWQARLSNTAGPTLCSTFEIFEPKICTVCPHRGFIKTPLQVGVATGNENISVAELPPGWRVDADGSGLSRLMIEPATGAKEWVKALRYVPSGLKATRSIVTSKYELQFDLEYLKSKSWSISLPGGTLGNSRKLSETMADYGLVFKGAEGKNFIDLMSTWLAKLQAARRVADVTEQLGWLSENNSVIGFSSGQTTFYADGRVRDDVRASREFSAISKYYEPKGSLEAWKKVASFITEQNNPAFTAVLASAFGAPLLRFTGMSGGILSIVSTASGVGKSSALKCAQAVWGSPIHGINAVDDTPKSVARKIGFLNNLPAFWDELRGKKTVEDFLTLAFQITQGKEKTRLDSNAHLRDMQTWETMLVVAANESIFEAMGKGVAGTDAGVVRTFELTIEPFKISRNRAEVSLLFEQLNTNYGHAGRIYAQYLATHIDEVDKRVQEVFMNLARVKGMDAQERFWFGIVSALLVGAEIAAKIGLVQIDQRTLAVALLDNISRLRGRAQDVTAQTSPAEVIAAYMQANQDKALIVDRFPSATQNTVGYIPDLTGGVPRSDKITYHVSREEHLIRFSANDFKRWLAFRELPAETIIRDLRRGIKMSERRCKLGIGTKWELPSQKCYEVSLDAIEAVSKKAAELILDGSLNPGGMSDSPSETPPED